MGILSFILVVVNLIIFILFNIYIIKEFDIPESLSETAYLMGNKYWTFSLICGFFAFTIFPIWLNILPLSFDFIKFLSCSGLLFVGATPFFKKTFDGKIHYTAAIISFIGFIAWFLINGLYIWLIIDLILFIISIVIKGMKYYIYFAEIIVWLTLLIYLIALV